MKSVPSILTKGQYCRSSSERVFTMSAPFSEADFGSSRQPHRMNSVELQSVTQADMMGSQPNNLQNRLIPPIKQVGISPAAIFPNFVAEGRPIHSAHFTAAANGIMTPNDSRQEVSRPDLVSSLELGLQNTMSSTRKRDKSDDHKSECTNFHETSSSSSVHLSKKSAKKLNYQQILESWILSHIDKPYPTAEEKEELRDITKLQAPQLDTWFVNCKFCSDFSPTTKACNV